MAYSHASPLALRLQEAWLQTQLHTDGIVSPPQNPISVEPDPYLGYVADLLMRENDSEHELEDVERIQMELTDLIGCRRNLAQDEPGFSENSSFHNRQVHDLFSEENSSEWMHRFPFTITKHHEELTLEQDFRSSLLNKSMIINSSSYQNVFDRLNLPDRDLLDLLTECATAVSNGDFSDANRIATQIRKRANPVGNVSQRMASFFIEALAVRISSLGGNMFKALCNGLKNLEFRAIQITAEKTPYLRLPHFFASQVILNACIGKKKIHVIDYGILFGHQWPALIDGLSKLPEGPPLFRLTGIDMPPPGFPPTNVLKETGSRLEDYARKRCVPFKYGFLSAKWEEIEPSRLSLKEDEVLIVNCAFRNHNLIDESVMVGNPRNMWLNKIRSMNPAVFIQCVKNVNYDSPFFVSRFIEAMVYHAVILDSFEHCIPRDHPDAYKFEQGKYCREILNVVACEGLERVERAESYGKAHVRTERAGFEIMSLDQQVFSKSRDIAASYHKEFMLSKDGGWMILRWKDQPVHAYSAWVPHYEEESHC